MGMTEENVKADEKEVSGRPPGRKPYQDPAFRHERVFETMALSCGKMSSTEFQCRFRRMSS